MTLEQRTVTLLGSTGSIGTQALEVIAAHPDRFKVTGLAAGSNAELLVEQARAHGVERVAVADTVAASRARAALGPRVEVLAGPDACSDLAGAAGPGSVVLNGMVGSRGLGPTLSALRGGSRLALANKESLIVGGPLVLAEAARARALGGDVSGDGEFWNDRIVPVDSEHSSLAQCLRAGTGREIARLVVTASGGPFRGRTRAELSRVTVSEALAHPTWEMGAVITVNSATLANKGLEVIEAHLLFGVPYERIGVVVHPQSVVHGMVEFCDGSTMASLSPPDMRLPIQLALGWPERLAPAPVRMDWSREVTLEFEPLDADTFPMVDLAVAAGRRGGTFPAVYNAANEEAVAAFLDERLGFLGVSRVVEAVLEEVEKEAEPAEDLTVDGLLAAESWARRRAHEHIA